METKEIGGYIEFEHFHGREYHENALPLNSGRHCVEYLVLAKGIRKILLPFYMCSSVRDICDRLGVETGFYHTGIDFRLIIDDKAPDDGEWIYIVNYYGQLDNEYLAGLKEKHTNIIVDNAQAFFQMPVAGVDTLYTCRKFFGVADGGYLYTDTLLEDGIETDQSYKRMEFLLGRFERGADEFYSLYVENNESFEGVPLRKMSRLTANIMRGIDYGHVEKTRTENFRYLDERLGQVNRLKLNNTEGAFMYPFYIKGGNELRKELQRGKIYIPTLWPDAFEVCGRDDMEYDMAENILPLPVDQRYGREEMDYLAGRILEMIGGGHGKL